MEWLKRIRRARRGKELLPLVPEMKKYVSDRYEPKVQHSIGRGIRYSLPISSVSGENKPGPVISDMKSFVQEAKKDMALYESPAIENTYLEWEKENAERKSFSSEVMRIVKEKFEKPSDFYRPAGIDKRTFHKMKSDYGYQPSKKTAIRCCIGLHMEGYEADHLLRLAGYAFSRSDPADLVVLFCLEHKIWDFPGINYMLMAWANSSLED